MNTASNQFPSLYTEIHNQIAQAITEPNEPALPPLPVQAERKTLRGYDLIMRQHAAACEAGR